MPASYAVKIEGDIADVLRRSTVVGRSVVLPPGQLDRKLYEGVNKVLELSGGKWNRKAKAHEFANAEGIDKFMAALHGGVIVDAKKALQQFFTPAGLADELAEQAQIGAGMSVLEPSAGAGAIARACRGYSPKITCVEIDMTLASALSADGFIVHCADFIEWTPELRFDRVVMNPPFQGSQDVDHITRAYSFLRPGGRLVAIAGAGIKQVSYKETRAFRALVESIGGSITDLPEGSFKESGTGVNTVLVIMEKP